jgi:hypothetical protein
MALFQNAVIKKYLQAQNKIQLQEKWLQFQNHFHNPTIQENIRNSKEEQYQGEFLIDLFVNILGYTKNPQPDFNLTTEYKNVKDSKKADGAILVDDKVCAVIELKGTNTTDLGKIETQAFGYKNNQSDCTYVITSNFEKLRFYIENAIEHGQLHTIEGGFIHVYFSKRGDMMDILIEDNGIGRKGAEQNKKSKDHKSMALSITRERIDNLSKKYRTEGTLEIEDFDKVLNTGTKVLISLPLRTENPNTTSI